jgi:hypothetical protein
VQSGYIEVLPLAASLRVLHRTGDKPPIPPSDWDLWSVVYASLGQEVGVAIWRLSHDMLDPISAQFPCLATPSVL